MKKCELSLYFSWILTIVIDADMAKVNIILDSYDPQRNSQIQVRVKFKYHDAVI